MNQTIIRGAVAGATLGGGIGGALAGIAGLALQGLLPIVFLTCGVYAGIVYGGIMGAVRAGRPGAQPVFQPAMVNRSRGR